MADYVRIQDGDLDDAATVTTIAGHENLADYVGFGLEIGATFTTSPPTYSVTEGKVFCLLETQYASGAAENVHDCLVTAHYEPRSGLALATETGVNYIWAVFNMGTDDSPNIEATTSATPPTADSVLIGEVDPVNETTASLNRYPSGEFELLTADDINVSESVTWPDGETTHEHPITYSETIDNQNNYYDTTAPDPPGTVAHATNADEADHAATADTATAADTATNADMVDGYSAQELLDAAAEMTAKPWTPLLNEPYVKDDFDTSPDVRFKINGDYDMYRVRLQVENGHDYSQGLGCNLNRITERAYHQFNLLPEDDRIAHRKRTDTWTVGDVMANAGSLHDFYIALPSPIRQDGPRNQYPVMYGGHQFIGLVRSYHLTGILTRDIDQINEIRLSTGEQKTAIKVQIYGQHAFPQ